MEDLACYLADLLLRDDYGVVPDVKEYADLLGEEAPALIRTAIAETFATEPSNWMARSWMEAQARADGDVDALIAVFATNLDSRGMAHMLIVRELENAGWPAEALTWAERGMRGCSFPDNKLADYLAGRYASAGDDTGCSSCAALVSPPSGLWPITRHSARRRRLAATGLPSWSPPWRNSARTPLGFGACC